MASLNLSKLKEVPFEPVKEPWNEYKLKDGTTLKFRLIAIKFFDTGEIDPLTKCPNYIVGFQNIVSVISEERGQPTGPSIDISKIPDNAKEEVEVDKALREDWNVYRVNGKYRYEVKPIIIAVYKLKGYFDQAGYPVYHVRSQNISKVSRWEG